jgi:hypothetical protein
VNQEFYQQHNHKNMSKQTRTTFLARCLGGAMDGYEMEVPHDAAELVWDKLGLRYVRQGNRATFQLQGPRRWKVGCMGGMKTPTIVTEIAAETEEEAAARARAVLGQFPEADLSNLIIEEVRP